MESVAAQHSLKVQLRPATKSDPEISGVILSRSDGSFVVSYPRVYAATHPWWTWLCVGHELGHLLCGHLEQHEDRNDAATVQASSVNSPNAQHAEEQIERFRCEVGVIVANDHEEQAAEYVGTLLATRIETQVQNADTRTHANRTAAARLAIEGVPRNFTRLLGG